MKLMCKNPTCSGSLLKRLQKGIIALEIRGLGPKVIEKLMSAGINSSMDLFDNEIFNEKVLISSGEFKKGRSLEKIITSVKNTKSLPIHKFILSLQIDDVGKTVSEKIGQLISGLDADFTGLPYSVRDNIDELLLDINIKIDKVEQSGIKIEKIEPPKKVVATKKVNKIVDVSGFDDRSEVREVLEKLNWEETPINENTQMLIVPDKKIESMKVDRAKDLGIKIMTLKQIKLLFL